MRKQYERLKRRPFLMPVWLTVLSAALIAGAGLWTLLAASTTVVIVVPAAPEARADALARLLDSTGTTPRVEALVAGDSVAVRARATALAARLDLAATMSVANSPTALARAALVANRGGRVVVVAASGDCPAVIDRLTGIEVGAPRAGEVFVVAMPRFSRPALLRLVVP